MENLFNQYIPVTVAVISLLAFLVSAITELIKDLTLLKKIPTNLVVLVLSIVISVLAYIIYCSTNDCTIYWYGIVGSFFGGFIVAYVSSYGWEKLHMLWERFRNRKIDTENKP